MYKTSKNEKSHLKCLQDDRDNANGSVEWQRAQEAIDVYFLGTPAKKKRKKPKRIFNYSDDEWDDYDF